MAYQLTLEDQLLLEEAVKNGTLSTSSYSGIGMPTSSAAVASIGTGGGSSPAATYAPTASATLAPVSPAPVPTAQPAVLTTSRAVPVSTTTTAPRATPLPTSRAAPPPKTVTPTPKAVTPTAKAPLGGMMTVDPARFAQFEKMDTQLGKPTTLSGRYLGGVDPSQFGKVDMPSGKPTTLSGRSMPQRWGGLQDYLNQDRPTKGSDSW